MNNDELQDSLMTNRTIDDDLIYNSSFIQIDGERRNMLIVCCKTGLFFDHQYDHYCCSHTNIEGFPLFLNADKVYNPCGYLEDLTEEGRRIEAEFVDDSLKNCKDDLYNIVDKLEFDYERVDEFREGLFPVDIWMKKFSIASIMSGSEINKELAPRRMKGYLFLHNCD